MTEQLQDDSELLSNLDRETSEIPGDYASEASEERQYLEEHVLDDLPDSNAVAAPIPSRIEALTAAIALHPEAPVNYVFRGEALLENNFNEEAAADFEKGLELADSLAESANWGYIYRALADRAREGLRQCLSHD